MHQHLEPVRDGRRGPARAQRRRARPAAPRRTSRRASRPARASSPTTSPPPACRSRSTRSASSSSATAARPASATRARSRTRSRRRARRRAGGLRGALGQPQLRGPHPPARARELSRLSPARRRLRARGLDHGRSRARAARHGRATAPRLPARALALERRGARRRSRRASRPSCSSASTRRSGTATSAGARCPRPRARSSHWDRTRPTCASRRSSRISSPSPSRSTDIEDARCLVVLGDSVTTDHISPAGAIPRDMPAGPLPARARRRAARLQLLRRAPRQPRGHGARHVRQHPPAQRARRRHARAATPKHLPSGEQLTIFDAAERYRAEGVPLVALVGKEYGSGSSRDWAAKGTLLLGIRAVIAESYERIHRSNLVGMGVLPLRVRRRRRRPRRSGSTAASASRSTASRAASRRTRG